MAVLSCPECKKMTQKGGYQTWQIVVAICFFPLGLLALLADKKPTVCNSCGHTWQGQAMFSGFTSKETSTKSLDELNEFFFFWEFQNQKTITKKNLENPIPFTTKQQLLVFIQIQRAKPGLIFITLLVLIFFHGYQVYVFFHLDF